MINIDRDNYSNDNNIIDTLLKMMKIAVNIPNKNNSTRF